MEKYLGGWNHFMEKWTFAATEKSFHMWNRYLYAEKARQMVVEIGNLS